MLKSNSFIIIFFCDTASDPEAVWVMQGWMFGYQRNIWNINTLKALLIKVPDDKMLLLDLAADYNKTFWRNGMNWDVFKGFFNKP
ncbi:MAG: alpha-N-acetylglucosaminidase TIM-barrel domain-containing protein [Akkermansia sp.]